MSHIINLTQHQATPEQRAAGVVDFDEPYLSRLRQALTFEDLPDDEEVYQRAVAIAEMAESSGCSHAMLGGAPFLMAPLEREVAHRMIEPLYAFSARVSIEEAQPDGSVCKVAVFRHLGFVAWGG